MKKLLLTPLLIFLLLFSLLFSFLVLIAPDEEAEPTYSLESSSLSPEVLKYQLLVEKYCKDFGIPDQVGTILAIMMVESKGKGNDVMQASESLGLPANSLDPEASIRQGCKYFSELLKQAKELSCDKNTAIQSYNFGSGFIPYVAGKGKKYSYELAESFSKEKAHGEKVVYKNEISIPINGGWRYKYGNQFYLMLVSQYLIGDAFSNETAKKVMTEALKYQGYPYVFGVRP